ncbi:cytochrome b [uncultured Sphingomonas sp.]|uniref:cytochrome b n=1 Tax=uncultured Sphingomonas sp. TaxID=158754 RepID=UPI0035CC1DA6
MATMADDRFSRTDDGRQLRYTNVAILLHWAIALGILYNLATGLFGEYLPSGAFAFHISSGITVLALTVVRVVWRLTHRPPPKLPIPTWQKRLADAVYLLFYAGMILLPLSGWAMVSASPPAGSPGAAWAAEHSRVPAPPAPVPTGKPAASAPGGPAGAGKGGGQPPTKHGPIMIWGLFPLPLIAPVSDIGRTVDRVSEQRALHERIEGVHLAGGWIMLALLFLHVAGALKHQFVDRERELQRMGLGGRRTA